jgi:cysteine synthase A
MLPDTAERYLSTPLFEHIGEEMTAEELEISRSTPGCRFDAPAVSAPAPTVAAPPVALDEEAVELVDGIVRDEPVVMFALEWCEFCWSVRKLFAKTGIPFRSVDLDSVAYQDGDLGGKIRAVLAQRTGAPTIPQIFIGGKHIGGCTDLFNAWREGSVQRQLTERRVPFNASVSLDPYSLLPKWLHPRKTA